MKIYKYFNFDLYNLNKCNKLSSLKENYLWFSKPQFFNDPFDCNMEVIKHYNRFLNELTNNYGGDTYDLILKNTKEFGICCFSETNDNIHMWSHYTNSHSGVCIEYDCRGFDDYFSELFQAKCHLLKVNYKNNFIDLNEEIEIRDKRRKFSLNEILRDRKLLDKLFEQLLLQKNEKDWSNEKERRMIIGGLARRNMPKGIELERGYKVPINRDMITSVVFGVNTSNELQENIKNILGHSVKYHNAELNFKDWNLKISNTY
jgi:hypothetical protein